MQCSRRALQDFIAQPSVKLVMKFLDDHFAGGSVDDGMLTESASNLWLDNIESHRLTLTSWSTSYWRRESRTEFRIDLRSLLKQLGLRRRSPTLDKWLIEAVPFDPNLTQMNVRVDRIRDTSQVFEGMNLRFGDYSGELGQNLLFDCVMDNDLPLKFRICGEESCRGNRSITRFQSSLPSLEQAGGGGTSYR